MLILKGRISTFSPLRSIINAQKPTRDILFPLYRCKFTKKSRYVHRLFTNDFTISGVTRAKLVDYSQRSSCFPVYLTEKLAHVRPSPVVRCLSTITVTIMIAFLQKETQRTPTNPFFHLDKIFVCTVSTGSKSERINL